MCITGEWFRCISLAGRNTFNDIIVWATVRACFKLLISFICQTVKVVCVGWVSNSPCWLMKKKKKKIMLWGWEPQKVGCGWYNGSVMILDVELGGMKKKHWAQGRHIYSVAQYSILLMKIRAQYSCRKNTYKISQHHVSHKQNKKSFQHSKWKKFLIWPLPSGVETVKPYPHVSYTSHHWNLV